MKTKYISLIVIFFIIVIFIIFSNRNNDTGRWYSGYLGTFGKNATKNFKLTLKSDTLLYEPLELIFPYKDTLSTPKTISSSIS